MSAHAYHARLHRDGSTVASSCAAALAAVDVLAHDDEVIAVRAHQECYVAKSLSLPVGVTTTVVTP